MDSNRMMGSKPKKKKLKKV
jgi:hypothetical protein